LRRQPAGDRSTLRWRDLAVDTAAHRVTRAGAAVEVSQKQFAVLEFLLRHTGQVVSRNMILEHVFGYRFDPGTNLVDVHVSHLRQRLDRPGEESIIQTIRGVGYRIGDE
jgi:two-component system OmpR family response regulator